MRFTLKVKMTLMGAGVALALTFLGGVIVWSNGHVHEATRTSHDIRDRLDMVRSMEAEVARLRMMAMECIVDRADGTIAPERMREIDQAAELLRRDGAVLEKTAANAGERERARTVLEGLDGLIRSLRVDLKRLIENSAAAEAGIRTGFAKMDDDLDDAASKIEDDLDELSRSFGTRGDQPGVILVRGMQLALSRMTLAAMDALVDREEGRISDERLAEMRTRADQLQAAVPALSVHALTAGERRTLEDIRTAVPALRQAMTGDLRALIENPPQRA